MSPLRRAALAVRPSAPLSALAVSLALALVPVLLAAPPAHPQESSGERLREALRLLEQSQPEQAERARALLEEAALRDPATPALRFQLGRLALQRGDLAAAEEHLAAAARSGPDRPAVVWTLLGQTRYLDRRPQAALEAFERALEHAPRLGSALVGRARAALLVDRPEAALADLERAAELAGARDEALLLAAETLLYLGRPEEALLRLDRLDPIDPERVEGAGGPPTREAAAGRLLALAIDPGGRRQLAAAVGRDADLAAGFLALAVAALERGDRAAARMPLEVALTLDDRDPVPALFLRRLGIEPRPPAAWPDLARVLAAAGRALEERDGERAAELARDILERRPLHVPARQMLVAAAELRGELWQALAGLRALTGLLAELPAPAAALADLARRIGALELAECACRQALERDPEDGALHALLAVILAARGEPGEAIAAAHRALALGHETGGVWKTLGDLHHARMEIPQSIAALGRAVELDPAAAESIAGFALASLTAEDQASLRALLESAAARPDAGANTLFALGAMYLREGELARARAAHERLLRLAPGEPEVHYNLGLIALRQGREEDGRREMERFRELKAREGELWERKNLEERQRREAELALAAGDAGRAIELYEALRAAAAVTAADLVALAAARRAAGDREAAVERLEEALELSPYDREAIAALAGDAAALGRSELAAAARERLALLEPPCAPDPRR